MAFGNGTFSDAAGAVADLYAASGHRTKAEGQRLEAGGYREAAGFAMQNEQFTEESTAIKQTQLDREAYKVIGGEEAAVAGSGFGNSGTALDLLRDSTSQAALTHAVAGRQGLITEEGYKEQANSYNNLAAAADLAASAEDKAAHGAQVDSYIKGAAAIGTLFT